MARNTAKLQSTGESVAQVEARQDKALEIQVKAKAWLAAGLSLNEVATLITAENRKEKKAARRADVMSRLPRERFLKHATPKQATIDGRPVLLIVRGSKLDKSMGWGCSEQVVVEIDGEEFDATLGINLTINGTKPVGK